jgi:glycosyltransferase involved in cell wall biosynthesis
MRILHYLPRIRLSEGGVVRAVLDLCTLLAENGHDVTLAAHDLADIPADWNTPGRPRAVPLGKPSALRGYARAAALQVGELVKASDVVHLHTPWLRGNVRFAADADLQNVPYCVTIHGMLDDWCLKEKQLKKQAYLRLVGRRILEGAAAIHCTAYAERDQACKHFDNPKIEVIPLTFDIDSYRELPDPAPARAAFAFLNENVPTALFLSRIHHKKGIEVLLRAIHLLRESPDEHGTGYDCRLLIAGTGDPEYTRSLKAIASTFGLNRTVEFLGHVSGELKLSLLAAADVFVLPTSQENFGLALTESLASGTPVITTPGVDIWPELEDSGGAMIVKAAPRPFADAIRELTMDPDRAHEMGRLGRRWVLEHLNPAIVTQRYCDLYQRLSTNAATDAA